MKLLLTALALLPLLATCQRPTPATDTASTQKACIDPSKIRTDAMCTMEYAPVCGCDAKTYSNQCQATNAGVTSFTKGPCAKQ